MVRILLLGAILTVTGCQSGGGSLLYPPPGRADDPRYSIAEQHVRGRERYAIVEDRTGLAPYGFIDRPGPTGR
jgi:hypothetical protein